MKDTIKAVSIVPINNVPSDSDDDQEDQHPTRRRKTIIYKVDIA